MPTLDEAIAVLVTESTDENEDEAEKKARTIAGRLYKDVKRVANVLIARGNGRANQQTDAKHKADLEAKQEEVERLTEERDQAVADADEAKKKVPDFAQRLKDQEEKHKLALARVKGELETERTGRKQDRVGAAVERFRVTVEKRISDPFVAAGIVAKHKDRFRLAENELGYEVLQPGNGDEVFAPGDNERPEDLLFDAVIEDVPEKFVIAGEANSPGGPVGRNGQPKVGAKSRDDIIAAKRMSGIYGGAGRR